MDNNKIFLDGKEVTVEQLNEAKNNNAVRIVEEKGKPGVWKTLKKIKG